MKKRISNVEVMYSVCLKLTERSDSTPPSADQSSFDIRHSNVVSHERGLWPQSSSQIKEKKLCLRISVGSATVPTDFGGHGGPPLGGQLKIEE